MNNDDIRKEFNETFGEKNTPPVEPYRVVQNNDNSFENASFQNLNSTNNSNITMPEFNNSNNLVNTTTEVNNPTDVNLYNTTNSINDRVVEKKTKKTTLKINPELQTAIVIALILLVAMSFIPVIFDFFNNLKLKIFG